MKTESNSTGGKMDIFWGQSSDSYDEAVASAVEIAKKDLVGKTLEWLEVVEFRGGFDKGKLQYQISVRIGYV